LNPKKRLILCAESDHNTDIDDKDKIKKGGNKYMYIYMYICVCIYVYLYKYIDVYNIYMYIHIDIDDKDKIKKGGNKDRIPGNVACAKDVLSNPGTWLTLNP
jgi:hypothetical protein